MKTVYLRFLAALIFVSCCARSVTQDALQGNVRIGVLGLFHPHEITVSAAKGQALVARAGGQQIVLERSSSAHTARVQLAGDEIVLQSGTRSLRALTITISDRETGAADFVLTVPGKITRHYQGTLEIRPSAGHLLAIITMGRETAVASIVAAENTVGTPFEALKAQAVATRSYLAASRGRHPDFDFCDTTHCQFLREPPAAGSAAARAVEVTRGMILTYKSEPFAAMYTGSGSGRTHTPAELGLPADGYPYYIVECKYCREHPRRWSSRISTEDAAGLRSSNEPVRLRAARRLGWSTIPSNDFVVTAKNGQVLVEGTGHGHGIGLCQAGAKAMAAGGADFRQILSHYYPNTAIVTLGPP